METFWKDVRYGLRMLVKAPTFALVALLTLGLGIGANTAIFSVLDAVLLRPLPYPNSDHLVMIWGRFTGIGIPKDQNWISAPEFRDMQQLQKSLTDLAAISAASYSMGVNGTPERLAGAPVSPSLFSILGVKPKLGRTFLPDEGQPGRAPVAVLSYGLWQRAFGGDESIVGRTIHLNDNATEVVGVMPQGFDFPDQAEIWTPLAFRPEDLTPDNRGNHGYEVLARIKPSLSLEQARAEMELVSRAVIEQHRDYPYERFNFKFLLNPLLDETVGEEVRTSLWVLMGAVGFVLLIACVNVACLMLARSASRERESAIRMALGAGTLRLVRQFLTESVVLAVLGGVLGLVVAPLMVRGLSTISAAALPRAVQAQVNLHMLAFTALLSIGTGIASGLIPALRSARGVQYMALKEGGRSNTAGPQTHRSLRSLVAAEAAVSLVLLVGAGLLLRSFQQVLNVEPGFRPDGVLTMRVSLPPEKYSKPEQRRAFYRDALARIQALPGVEVAGAVSILPLSGQNNSGTTTIDTQAVPSDQRAPEADWRAVTPGLFKALGVELLEGRGFEDHDNETGAPVAIVDETLAKTYWPNESAVGKRLHLGGAKSTRPWMTVVGVVRHVRYRTLEAKSRVEVYWPEAQNPYGALSLAIRTPGDPRALATAVRQALQSVDPNQPVYRVRTMQEWMAESVARRRLALILLALFAGIALLLAAAGIYGTTSFGVTQRYQEMGVRIALGASRGNILRLVLRQGMSLTLAGLGLGVVGALLLTRWVRSMLFGVSPVDPIAIAGGIALLAGVAFVACYLPARRATRVDPMIALRYE